MKLLLQILWGWSVLANGAVGIQVGTIQTNNQNIKLMKFNYNNPAFLQASSNVGGGKPVTRFVFVEGQNQVQLSSNGNVTVECMQGGEKVRETYSALNDTAVTINADTGTEIVIYGAVTKIAIYPSYPHSVFASLDLSNSTALTYLDCSSGYDLTSLDLSNSTALTYLKCNSCESLTSLDLSNNTALTYLDCSACTSLTSLDLSNSTALNYLDCFLCSSLTSLDLSNSTALTHLECASCESLTSLDLSNSTALTYLNCAGCSSLLMLNIKNTAELNDGKILDQSMANLTTLQVAGTSEWACDNVESWLSDFAPNDGTILVDENTPQEVIEAATTKGWTVEYVDS